MAFDADAFIRFESLVEDALQSFAYEHGPLVRETFRVSPDVPVFPLVASAFLGRAAQHLVLRFGRDNFMAALGETLDRMEDDTRASRETGIPVALVTTARLDAEYGKKETPP